MITRGFLVVLEGTDSSGKSAQTRLLSSYLSARGYVVRPTREPTDTAIGSYIRQILVDRSHRYDRDLAELFAVDRRFHARDEILPALAAGSIVVCDRYDLSNAVYRAAEVEGPFYRCLPCGWTGEPGEAAPLLDCAVPSTCPRCLVAPVAIDPAVLNRARWARDLSFDAPRPDLTVVLTVSIEVAEERRRKRGGAVELFDGARTQARCCALYARAGKLERPGENVVLVDGAGEEDEVAARVRGVVDGALEGAEVA
jgi:dTMP kinase